jgi:hydrogenase maturation factor/FMN phosphatase YigB (HAD superfamily)
MTMKRPFQVSAVLWHLEGTLARPAVRPRPMPSRCRPPAAAAGWTLHPAAARLLALLRSRGVRTGVFSRWARRPAACFLKELKPALGGPVPVLIAAEDFRSTAPRRSAFRAAAKRLQTPLARTLVISAERRALAPAAAAGAITVLVSKDSTPEPVPGVDFQISDLRELTDVLRLGLPLPPGKLPNDLLRQFLAEFKFEDPSLIICPGVGEDIAAVDVAAEEVLVLKSDPITFATDAIGQYAVLVNANDIATAGAAPRWLLTTLLFPVGSAPSLIWSVVRELKTFTQRWGITLCGGHTEITDAVRRPVVAGMMAGTVRRRDLIDKRRMRTGDRILLTKAVAVEGTAIIAREFAPKLAALGLSAAEIRSCREFLDSISILPEAGIAAAANGTSAMHDVTEGGIATALEELSAAGGFGLRVAADRIPVFSETRKLCRLLRIDPLGLIGSGSLLICCRPGAQARLEAKLRRVGIRVTAIGTVGLRGEGVLAFRNGRPVRWPSFEVDEIARLFAKQ